jgi:hypothetical protein
MHHEHDDADQEENPRDLRGDRRDSEETESSSHQTHQQKDQCVVEHRWFLLAETKGQLSCQRSKYLKAEGERRAEASSEAPRPYRLTR